MNPVCVTGRPPTFVRELGKDEGPRHLNPEIPRAPTLHPAPTRSKPLTLPKQQDWRVQPTVPGVLCPSHRTQQPTWAKGPMKQSRRLLFNSNHLLPSTFFSQRALVLAALCPQGRHSSPCPAGGQRVPKLWPMLRQWTAVRCPRASLTPAVWGAAMPAEGHLPHGLVHAQNLSFHPA